MNNSSLQVHKLTLPNGLRVVIVEMPHLHTLEMSMYVKVGSRFETPFNNGISHLLEHMLFRGTKNKPDSYQLLRAFESLGGDINAFTTTEYTCFWLTLHPVYLDNGMSLLAEMFGQPTFQDLETEKHIILEEILNECNEKGEHINIDDLSSFLLWPNDSLSLPTLGSKENILRFTEDDLRSFFHTYYTASNMVLCLAGRVSCAQVLPHLTAYFAGLSSGQEAVLPVYSSSQKKAQTLFKKNPGSQTNVQICFRTESYYSSHYYTLLLLRRIFDDGNSSLLQWNLREKQGLVYDISACISAYYDTGTFDIDFSVGHEKISKVVAAVLNQIRSLTLSPIPFDLFKMAKDRYLMEFDFAFDSMGRMADRFGWNELFHKPESLQEERETIEQITHEQIFELCRKCFVNSMLNISVVGQYSREEKEKVIKLAKEF